PRPDVRNLDTELHLLRVRLDPDRFLAPLAGPRALTLLDREADEGNAESVYCFLAPVGSLLDGLVEYVVVGAAQPPPDDLLGEEWRAEGAQAEDVRDTLHVPALGEHVHAHDGAHVLTWLPPRADRVDHLAQHGLVALVGVEDLGVDLDGHP